MRLSSRYVTERHLPDKAIDLIDEAASKHVIDAQETAPEVRAIARRLDALGGGGGRGRRAGGPRARGAHQAGGPPAPGGVRAAAHGGRRRAPLRAARLRGGHRRARRADDGHPRLAARGDGNGEAPAHGGDAARARGGAGPRHRGAQRRRAPGAGGAQGPEAPHRLVHLPGPHGRREDGAGEGARAVPVRRRGRDDPAGHVGVPGAAHGEPHGRRAAGLRRLRRGGRPDRAGPAPALPRHPLRRDREGAPGRVQHAPPDPRRRTADRRPRPHGRLPQHGHHHDQQPGHGRAEPAHAGLHAAQRGERRKRPGARVGRARPARALPPRVPEPHRRHDRVRAADEARAAGDRRPARRGGARAALRGARSPSS